MVTVPQYSREVKPQNTPLMYESVQVNSDMFGGNIAQAGQRLGGAIQNAGDAVLDVKDMVDQTKIMEIANKSSDWEQQNLYDKEKGFFYKTGKDAYGQSKNIIDSYDKTIDELITNSGLNPGKVKRAQEMKQRMKERIVQSVNAHDFKEGVNWSNTEAQSGIQNAVGAAVNARNNPKEIQTHIASINQIIDWQAAIQHKDAGSIAAMKQAALSDVHEAVLSSYLAEGSLKASEYLEKHKSEINPAKLPNYINAAKDNELSYTARNTAQNLIGLPIADAYKSINGITDPQTRNAVEREYNHLKSQQDNIQRENDIKIGGEIMQEVYTMYDNGGNISEIMSKVNRSNLSLETKEKIYRNLKDMQELEQAGNNWADYNYLLDMAGEDNEMFKNTNPATYNLTKEQYQKIVEMQRNSKDVQYTPEAKLKEIVNKFDVGFAPQTPGGIHSSEYKADLIKFLSKVERLQGKAFDINHLDEGQLSAIMSGFEYKSPNATNKNIDEVKELYMRAKKHGEIYDMAARQYTAFKQEHKREPQPEEMYEIVKRSYNSIETEYKQKSYGKVNNIVGFNNSVGATIPKKGETKVLTYMADNRIPQIGKELGIKYTYVSGSRYRAGDIGGHGKGHKLDVSMSEHSIDRRIKSFEAFAAEPGVTSIGTSDPLILKRFAGNPKLRDLRNYDLNYKKTHPGSNMNHANHFDISFDTRFGGIAQGDGSHPTINKPTYMSSAK